MIFGAREGCGCQHRFRESFSTAEDWRGRKAQASAEQFGSCGCVPVLGHSMTEPAVTTGRADVRVMSGLGLSRTRRFVGCSAPHVDAGVESHHPLVGS